MFKDLTLAFPCILNQHPCSLLAACIKLVPILRYSEKYSIGKLLISGSPSIDHKFYLCYRGSRHNQLQLQENCTLLYDDGLQIRVHLYMSSRKRPHTHLHSNTCCHITFHNYCELGASYRCTVPSTKAQLPNLRSDG